jgi:hypothetical protein
MDYLVENGWTIDPGGRFFAQINQSEVLGEFLNAVIGPAEQKQLRDEASERQPAEIFISTRMRTRNFAINLNGISQFYFILEQYRRGMTVKLYQGNSG